MSLNNIKTFEYKPSKSETIIGGNGSGKTSLLEQLTPYIDGKDFKSGGEKVIVFSHRDSDYTLSFTNNKYSFIKNGKELNDGHTMKVQNKLIVEHLQLTPMMNDMFLNRKQFVTMSVKERKEWLTLISPSDYTYVLSVYQNTKTKLRDLQGLKREYATRLKKIEENLEDEEVYTRLKSYIDTLKETLSSLHTDMSNLEEVDDVIKQCHSTIQTIRTLKRKQCYYQPSPIINEKLNANTRALEEIKKSLTTVGKIELTDKEILYKEKQEVVDAITHTNTLAIPLEKIEKIDELVQREEDKIRTLLNQYFEKQVVYQENELEKHLKDITLITTRLQTHTKTLDELRYKYTTLIDRKSKESISCPSCHTEFKVGYNENDEVSIKVELNKHTVIVDELTLELSKLNARVSEITIFMDIENALKELAYLTDGVVDYTDSKEVYDRFTNILQEKEMLSKLVYLKKRISELEEKIKVSESTDEQLQKIALSQREELLQKEKRLFRKEYLLKRNIKTSLEQENLRKRISELEEDLTLLTAQFTQFERYAYNRVKNEYIQTLIRLLESELTKCEEQLRRVDNDYLIYKRMSAEVEDTNKQIVIFADIEKALSPNKGLIAKSIIGFLNVFINHVNEIIRTTWSYDMRVLVPEVTESDLDYKFPVYVEGKIRKDISQTSTGMRAIINLAFKLASMSFLKMNDFPIYLDEFGSSFDVEHRRKTIELIKRIQDDYPQVFIISHYDDVLYSLDNNVINLSGDSMTLAKNKKHNQNVSIS
jgi:DNA repair exonuclease SbcCD ATPase subunit